MQKNSAESAIGAKKPRYVRSMIVMLRRDFGDEKGQNIIDRMLRNLNQLICDNADEPKALKKHTNDQIYPLVAIAMVLQEEGMKDDEIFDYLNSTMMEMCAGIVRPIQKILKLFGLWRIVPHLFNTMTAKLYGPDAGFESTPIVSTNQRSRFDMTRCPYHDTFTRLGYPELCRICCNSDDATYGNLHPNLVWNRTKTLARGGDVCDFDIYIDKK